MDYFIRYAERKDVQELIETAMEHGSVQGVVLEIDATWLIAWRLKETFGQERAEHLFRRYLDFLPPFRFLPSDRFFIWPQLSRYWIPSRSLSESDLKWRPPYWDDYHKLFWDSPAPELPIIIKICLFPADSHSETKIFTFENNELRIVFETRPPAVLYANKTKYRPIVGGISIGAGQQGYGTLGGVLHDPSGQHYGLTCAHVVTGSNAIDQPAWFDGKTNAPIGQVIHTSSLKSCAANAPCSPWATGAALNDMDASLIKIDSNVVSKLEVLHIGKLSRITPRSKLTQGQVIEFAGRSSVHSTLELGGMGIVYRIKDIHNNWYCFQNLIELKQPSYWRNVISSPVDAGDSGAWVCVPAKQDYEWCAMVIGGDRFTGFAIPSETIENWWCNSLINMSLYVA